MGKRLTDIFGRRGNSRAMMVILIAVILASPVADLHPKVGAALALVVLGCVLAGASYAGNKRIVLMVGIPLSGLWLLARLLEEFGDGRHLYNHLAHVAGFALSCTLLWALFDRILGTPEVTSSVIAEAVMIYLIIAIAYSQLYWVLNEFVAEPFNHVIAPSDGTSFLYFSMVTITGVGYGGILPINPYVRLVATFESMSGIFYIALVVARLVSSYNVRSNPPE